MQQKIFPLSILIFLSITLPALVHGAESPKNDRVIKAGMIVTMEYTLKGTDGKIIETTKGKAPLKYMHGQRVMIPGLEKELEGMKVGGEKHITVKPEDAYGQYNSKAFQEVPKDKIPPNGLKVGAFLATKTPDGGIQPMRIHQIKEKTVVLDLNHPLAGKTLEFDVKILDIQPPHSTVQSAKPPVPAKPSAPEPPAKAAEPAKK